MVKGNALPIAHPDQPLGDLLIEFSKKRCGCLLVTDDQGVLLGIFTDGDLRRALFKKQEKILSIPIKKLMSHGPKWVDQELLASKALLMMEEDQQRPVSVLPVLENKKLIGLVKMHDILQSGLA